MTLYTFRRIDGSTIAQQEAKSQAEAISILVRRGVSFAFANLYRANLDSASLDGANLCGASLKSANLNGASLKGASLDGASLDGANLNGALVADDHEVRALLARATRVNVPYEFFLWHTDTGHIIRAGYRTMTLADYREHVASPDFGSDAKRAETTRILDYFEATLKAEGVQP